MEAYPIPKGESMAKIVRREQFIDAVLRLRAAQRLADEAVIVYYTHTVDGFHLDQLERVCDEIESRIAAFRLELQAQRSRVEPLDVVDAEVV